MDWYDPTDSSPPIISPQAEIESYLRRHGEKQDFGIKGGLLMLETGGDIMRLKPKYAIEEAPFQLPAFLGRKPLFVVKGDPDLQMTEGYLGAPTAVDALETAIAMGCERLYAFGLCGAIGKDVEIGDMVVPTEIVREEGTSYHYAPIGVNAKPHAMLVDSLVKHLTGHREARLHCGKTVSTDAVFRQTLRKELRWRSEGILGVDMEMSAILTVSAFRGVAAVCLLVVSDKHVLDGNSEWHWGGPDFDKVRVNILGQFIEFVRKMEKTHT